MVIESDNFEYPFLEFGFENEKNVTYCLCDLFTYNLLIKHWIEPVELCLQIYYKPITYESDVRKLLTNDSPESTQPRESYNLGWIILSLHSVKMNIFSKNCSTLNSAGIIFKIFKT